MGVADAYRNTCLFSRCDAPGCIEVIAAVYCLVWSVLPQEIPCALRVKHPIIDIINLLHGDRFVSQTLSNMGRLDVPQEMVPYISDIDFILGRQRGNSGAFSCLCYNGKVNVHMTRKIARDTFEQSFLEQLNLLGLSVGTSESALA